MEFKYNSINKEFKTPFGAVKKGDIVKIAVKSDADSVILHGFEKPVKLEKMGDIYSCEIKIEKKKGIYFYHFEAIKGKKTNLYGRGIFGKCEIYKKPYQLTVHDNAPVPKWFKGATMYQIYVDRFFKGDDVGTKMRDNVLIHSSWNDKPLYVRKKSGEIASWDFFGGNLS